MSSARTLIVALVVVLACGCGDSSPVRRDAATDTPSQSLEGGEKCVNATQCKSRNCADGVCCETACVGKCIACNLAGSLGKCSNVADGDDVRDDCQVAGQPDACKGVCDGNAACRFPGTNVECGGTCVPGTTTVEDRIKMSFCDGAGTCVASSTEGSCGGYTCKDGKCRDKPCDDNDVDKKCTGEFQCVSTECQANLPPGSACGTNNNACASKMCRDGVCCTSDCSGTCERCDSTGTCVPEQAGAMPMGDCEVSGQPVACRGSCDGNRACTWPTASCKAGTCGTGSDGSPVAQTYSCNMGSCPAQPNGESSCNFSLCSGGACMDGCATKSDCVANSVCDRTAAHTTGRGACVDPTKVQTVTTTIQDAVNAALGASKTHVVVPNNATPYTAGANITSGAITIIGDGSVTVRPTSGAAFSVTGGGLSLSLQNVTVNQSPDVGVSCGSLGAQSTLVVVESTISSSAKEGVFGTKCNVTLRRNTINNNTGGGVSLGNGAFTLVNDVIYGNGAAGAAGSDVGGVGLSSVQGALVFANNTVADNLAKTGVAAGISCAGSADTVRNSIVWGNLGGSQFLGCSFEYSTVQGASAPAGTGNLNVDCNLSATYRPQAAGCFNVGSNTAAGVGAIDRANDARVKGNTIDLGAYEVQ